MTSDGIVSQIDRNATADTINEQVVKGMTPLYFLYLRPFDVTNSMKVRNPTDAVGGDGIYEFPWWDLEEIIARATSDNIVFVGMEARGKAIGAGGIYSSS